MLTQTDGTIHTADVAPPIDLPLDPAKYRAGLDGFDLTEAQRQELLLILWDIMHSFVELGFSVDVCGAVLGDPAPTLGRGEAE